MHYYTIHAQRADGSWARYTLQTPEGVTNYYRQLKAKGAVRIIVRKVTFGGKRKSIIKDWLLHDPKERKNQKEAQEASRKRVNNRLNSIPEHVQQAMDAAHSIEESLQVRDRLMAPKKPRASRKTPVKQPLPQDILAAM